MKGYGDDHGILELFEDSFKADMKFLHTIGMIATGMFDSSCYFLADYGQGLMLLTMQAPIVDQLDRDHALVLLKVFPEAISNFVFAHEPALEHYVKLKGYSVENDGKHLKASKGNFILEATFDDLGRMTKLTGGEKPEGV